MGEIQKTADESAVERRGLELEKDKLERKQRKLLEAHYADAIPLDLFKEEQDTIADIIAAIDRQLDLHGILFGEVREKLSKTLDIMEGCGKTYRTAPEHIKRIYNQAIFEKIYIIISDNTCEITPQFAAPYGLIYGQPSENDEPEQAANPAPVKFYRTSLISMFLNGETAAHIHCGGGSNKNLLVDVNGLEPLTLRTSSECSTS